MQEPYSAFFVFFDMGRSGFWGLIEYHHDVPPPATSMR